MIGLWDKGDIGRGACRGASRAASGGVLHSHEVIKQFIRVANGMDGERAVVVSVGACVRICVFAQ